MSFHEYSKTIVEDYLGTVAYVDDIIFSNRTAIKPVELNVESTRDLAVYTKVKNTEQDSVNEHLKQLEPNINPFKFTNAFSKKGIHCALLELEESKNNIDSIKKTLKKSDVIILDWQMHNDQGDCTCELIEFMLKEDANISLTLRLIVIYTDQPTYNRLINEKIAPIFKKLGIVNCIEKETEIESGHTKIIVLQKSKVSVDEIDKISGDQLPDRIIEEMTLLTEGLVSNTALNAITVIRKNSHKLLGLYHKNLDFAFLAHRAMLLVPEDAELLIKESIIDSINSIITYSNINENCSYSSIDKWIDINLDELNKVNLGTGNNKINVEFNKQDLKDWQKNGYKDFLFSVVQTKLGKALEISEFNAFEKFKLKEKSSECFCVSEHKVEGINEEFAILTHHKNSVITPSYVPYLTLGVLVKRIDDDKYFLCIQQKCDSMRLDIEEKRTFLFLSLSEEGSYPIIFKNQDDQYIKLKVNDSNCHDLSIFRFMQTNNGTVTIDENQCFTDASQKKYKWILDLKDSHAQRIANKFAAQLSRVGLDESEWLRRS